MKKLLKKRDTFHNIHNLPDSILLFPPFIYRKVVRLLKGDILDIGGGNGAKLMNLLNTAEYSKIKSLDLIEPSPRYKEAINKLKKYKKAKVYHKELKDILAIKKQYDIILFFEVIEHLPVPEFAIRDIKKLLKPTGVLILSTPNKHVYHFLCRLKKETIDPTHISEMPYKELERLMNQYFKVNYFFGGFPFPLLTRKIPPLDFINKFFKKRKSISRIIYCFSSEDANFKIQGAYEEK